MFSSSSLMLLWLALGLLLFWSVGAYNRLLRLRVRVLRAFGALDAQLLRHVGLLPPAADTKAGPPAEVGDAGGCALRVLHAASAQFAASLAAARVNALDCNAVAALAAAREVLLMAWENAQPIPAALDAPASASAAWMQWCRQSERACAAFNAAVELHNSALAQFPAHLLATLFGFKKAGSL